MTNERERERILHPKQDPQEVSERNEYVFSCLFFRD